MEIHNKNAVSRKSNEAYFQAVEADRGSHVVIVTAMGASIGDEPRIYAGFDSRMQEAVFAQVTVLDGVGKLMLCEKAAGIVRQIGEYVPAPGIAPGSWFEFALCCESGRATAMVVTPSGVPVRCRARSQVALGEQCGIGSGMVTKEVRYSHFVMKRHFPSSCLSHPLERQDGCPHCGEVCPCCELETNRN